MSWFFFIVCQCKQETRREVILVTPLAAGSMILLEMSCKILQVFKRLFKKYLAITFLQESCQDPCNNLASPYKV